MIALVCWVYSYILSFQIILEFNGYDCCLDHSRITYCCSRGLEDRIYGPHIESFYALKLFKTFFKYILSDDARKIKKL